MKKLLVTLLPFISIFLVWMLFAHPFFVRGNVPFPSTYLVDDFAPWSAYPELSGPVKNGAMPDVIGQIFPWKTLVIDSWKEGQIPLWNPYSFSGTPLLANYQSAALSPFNLLYFILSFINAWSIQILLQPLLAGIFMFFFARSLNLSGTASLVSSLAFMFCGFITTWMAYGTLGYAILFLPLALFSIEKYLRSGNSRYLLLLAATFPLSFFSGHFQMSIYFAVFVLLYIIFKSLSMERRKTFFLLAASAIGVLLTSPQLLPSIEFYFESVRSELFLKLENIPWGYLPTFLAPDFYGNPVTRNDWFGHYAEWNAFIGVIPLMLAFYSLRNRDKNVVFFFLVSLLIIFLSFQSPLLDLLVALKIPVISTSAASRIIVLFSFSMAVLAGFGFDKLFVDIKGRDYKKIYLLLGAFGIAYFILLYIVTAKLLIPIDKNQIAFSNLRLPLLMFGSFALILVGARFIKSKRLVRILPIVVLLIIAFDVLRFASKWMPFDPRELVYPKVPIVGYIRSLDENYRGLGNYGAEAAINFSLPYLEGYDPLYSRRYGEFMASVDDGRFHNPERSVVTFPKHGVYADRVLNLLGVKYIIHKISDGRQIWAYPFWEYPVDQFVKVHEDEGYEVYENHRVFDRAYIVSDYTVSNNEREILKNIYDQKRDLKNSVILEKDISETTGTGSADITNYTPNEIEIKAKTDGRAVLFLSDPYYPGWKAFVNGGEADVLRADYAFRAVVVPEGESTVRLVYDPASFKYGLLLALLGFVGIVPLIFFDRKYIKNV